MYFALKNIENRKPTSSRFPIDAFANVSENNKDTVEELLLNAHSVVGDMDAVTLSDDSRQVSDHIAGYVSVNAKPYCQGCCDGC